MIENFSGLQINAMSQKLQDFIDNWVENLDLTQPRTSFHNLGLKTISLIEEIIKPGLNPHKVAFFRFFLSLHEINPADIVHKAKSDLKNDLESFKDEDGAEYTIIQAMSKVDYLYPGLVVILLTRNVDLFRNAEESFRFLCIHETAVQSSGESKADKVRELYRELCQPMYYSYCAFLYEMSLLISGSKSIRRGRDLGKMLKYLTDSSELGNLIDPEANFIRNAFSHGHYRYFPGEEKMLLWNKKRTQVKAFTVEGLLQKGKRMMDLSGERFRIAFVFYLKKMFVHHNEKVFIELSKNLKNVLKGTAEFDFGNMFSEGIDSMQKIEWK